ncbi:MAG: hypothetical protein JKY37_27565 [Nannocystaceae bacterium]|nr:hypothetical protein [Nannocystaceae bacterium]
MASHVRKNLVQRPDARVDQCSCGVYHVATGAVTLRMRRPQIEALFEALGVALAPALADDQDGEPPVH